MRTCDEEGGRKASMWLEQALIAYDQREFSNLVEDQPPIDALGEQKPGCPMGEEEYERRRSCGFSPMPLFCPPGI